MTVFADLDAMTETEWDKVERPDLSTLTAWVNDVISAGRSTVKRICIFFGVLSRHSMPILKVGCF